MTPRSLLVCLSVFLVSTTTAAETPPDPKPIFLQSGDRAPTSGFLMSPRRAAKLAAKAEGCAARVVLVKEEVTKVCQFDTELLIALRAVDVKAFADERELLLRRLKEATGVPWYERPLIVAVGASVATVAAIWMADAVTPQ